MRKLKLDSLSVETFETSRPDSAPRGTVQAHAWTQYDPTCGGLSCDVACRTRYQYTCMTACYDA